MYTGNDRFIPYDVGVTELPIVSPSRHLSGPLMEHLARRLRAESESELERFGLRARHVIALTLLRDLGERPQADLAHVLSIDPTNVVGLLNDLESDGLVERRVLSSLDDDQRATLHTLLQTAIGESANPCVETTPERCLGDS